MKPITLSTAATAFALALTLPLALAGCSSQPQSPWGDPPKTAQEPALEGAAGDEMAHIPAAVPTEQHRWLQQLVGRWSFSCEATMSDGAEPFRMEGSESVRPVGGLWVVAEGSADMGGQPMRSVMTLGYQPEKQVFVGTWFDTVQTHLWVYSGSLDAEKTTLTLDTEGPSFDDPSKTSRYRDTIELKDEDRKLLTSSVQGADGKWMTFMRAEYRRVR
jgi:hypothetical protein